MTPDQALEILDRAASMVAAPRNDHIAISQAVQVLAEAIKPKEEVQPKEEVEECPTRS